MSPKDSTAKKIKKILITITIITTNFAWPTNATGDDRPLLQIIAEDITTPILSAITKPMTDQIGNNILKNAELNREFSQHYKSSPECKIIKDMATMDRCSNAYKSARANSAKNKETVKINNENEIIRLQKVIAARQARKESINIMTTTTRPRKTQPECFEKSTGKRISCEDDYITEKAAFAASKR